MSTHSEIINNLCYFLSCQQNKIYSFQTTFDYIRENVNLITNTHLPIIITGDDRCLFHCISMCLFGNENFTHLIKIATVYTLIQNESYFQLMIRQQYPSSLTFEKVIENNATNRIWGDTLSMLAISMLIKRPIYSYTPYSKLKTNPNKYKTYPILIYLDHNHFSALLPLRSDFQLLSNAIPVLENDLLE